MKKKNLSILLILLSLAMLIVSGCDDRDLPTSTDANYRIVRLESTVDLIYADNNVTFSYISAYVKDSNNFPSAEIPVRFQADRGSIITLANTNQSGIAKVPFYDEGEVGDAIITAYVYTYSQYDATEITGEDSKSITVKIAEKPPVGDLTIEISSEEFIVNQSVLVRARVFDALTNPVADSTMIRFETDRGFFVAEDGETNMGSIAIIPTQNGMAPLNLNVGQQAGMGTVSVRIDTLLASRNFNVKPGNPFNLELVTYLGDDDLNVVEETSETTIDNEYNIVIQANLKDAYNNASPNKVIRFETDLGTFYNTAETYTQNTDANGVAKVIFTPGLSAGPATIKAFANGDTLSTEALFTIKSEELYSIRFNTQDQVTLNVANTGGIDSKILYVNLYDINGNLVDRATDIYFKIINQSIPGAPESPAYLSGQVDGIVHTTSSGGQAAVSVVAGTGSGVIQLRVANQEEALSNTQVEGAITATKGNVLIQAGPPANISWGDVAFDQAEPVGGGMWELLMSVSVKDAYNNPVAYGTTVFFELTNQDNLPATIQANGYTGNGPEVTTNDAGASQVDSLSSIGIAYTLLTYSGSLTYSDLELKATSVGGYGQDIAETYTIEVPWNQPDTDIQVNPGNIAFWDGDPGAALNDFEWAYVTVRARDGQGYPTAGVVWTFTADRGIFYHQLITTNETNQAITDAEGYARIRLKLFRAHGLPSPDGVTPGQQQVQIEGRVLGTGITQRATTIILRYPLANPEN